MGLGCDVLAVGVAAAAPAAGLHARLAALRHAACGSMDLAMMQVPPRPLLQTHQSCPLPDDGPCDGPAIVGWLATPGPHNQQPQALMSSLSGPLEVSAGAGSLRVVGAKRQQPGEGASQRWWEQLAAAEAGSAQDGCQQHKRVRL